MTKWSAGRCMAPLWFMNPPSKFDNIFCFLFFSRHTNSKDSHKTKRQQTIGGLMNHSSLSPSWHFHEIFCLPFFSQDTYQFYKNIPIISPKNRNEAPVYESPVALTWFLFSVFVFLFQIDWTQLEFGLKLTDTETQHSTSQLFLTTDF